MEEYETYEKKARFYLDSIQEVHVTTKSGTFYNCFIKEIGADFMIVDDRRLGRTIIFFLEVVDIVPYEVMK